MFIAKVLLLCTVCVLASAKPQAPKQLEGEELVESQRILQSSPDKLAAGEGPHYRISRILPAVEQSLRDGVTNGCDVEIRIKSLLPNAIDVTYNCPEPVLVKNHSA